MHHTNYPQTLFLIWLWKYSQLSWQPEKMYYSEFNNLPDVRDGLTRNERVVLYCIRKIQKECDGRNVPTVMVYGRVLEHVDMSENELQMILQRLTSYNV